MRTIVKATKKDAARLCEVAEQSFLESHGHSAPKKDIDSYLSKTYNPAEFEKEINDPKNNYYIIYDNTLMAGYSKIVFDHPYDGSNTKNIAKLERIYLLKQFYGMQLGMKLLEFNIEFAKEKGQLGLWLYTWIENKRAVNFYLNAGFKIIGKHDFKLSETHSNPNHQMLLEF